LGFGPAAIAIHNKRDMLHGFVEKVAFATFIFL
jgi:hypothetical protein